MIALAVDLAEKASMEPGHEDREYLSGLVRRQKNPQASMEPGHEDREYQLIHVEFLG